MAFLYASGVFAVVFVLVLVILAGRGGTAEEKRGVLRRMIDPESVGGLDIDITRKSRKGYESQFLGALYRLNLFQKLEENMWQAGLYMRVSEMLLIIVMMFGGGAALGRLLWNDTLFSLGLGFAIGVLPILYIRIRRQRRLKAFIQQLPFALDLIKSSLEAGHSLGRGLQVVVQEFGDPLGSEFRTVVEQTRIGLPLPRALEDMLTRVPEDDLRLLVVAVKVQTEVGSSLAQIVGRLGEIVRTRQRLRMQIRALTAQSRLGGTIVGLLPIFVLSAFALIQPSYTKALFFDPTGFKILKAAIALDAAAFITIRRLLRLQY
jgi:tight adherence protein B